MSDMNLPAVLQQALETDTALAARHDIEFSVVGRPSGSTPPHPGPAPHHGTFTNPGDAVTLARSITDHDITILLNGRGAYWHASAPDQVDSKLLRLVCRDRALGHQKPRGSTGGTNCAAPSSGSERTQSSARQQHWFLAVPMSRMRPSGSWPSCTSHKPKRCTS